jgi:cell division protein FtsQ
MWDDHRRLTQIAAFFYAIAALGVAYGVLMTVIRLPVFPLREIAVQGAVEHTTREQIETIARRELRGNFFTVDLEAARGAFEKLPWVRRAALRRTWPDRLGVMLEEHRPLARWRDVGLVNTHGEVFAAASAAQLPVFVGPQGSAAEMTEHYLAFRDALAGIGRSVRELRLSSRRAWQVRLDDGRVLELGRQDAVQRLERFAAVYPRVARELPHARVRIDLRYPNGFAVRLPGASAARGVALARFRGAA